MKLLLNPAPGDFTALEAAQPFNPFATVGHGAALVHHGATVGILQLADDSPGAWAHAVLRRGRIGASLEVPSLPGEITQAACKDLRALARTHGITAVDLQTFCSPERAVVRCAAVHTVPRTEYVWILPEVGELIEGLSRTHRERARKAQKAGAIVSQLPPDQAMSALRQLHSESLDRREARGEQVARGEFEFGDRLVASAGARAYGVTREGILLAAVLVALSAQGAYTVYSGNTAEGMKLGAAHWLRLDIAGQLRDEGIREFNLAGATADQVGLADFKRRFGTSERHLAHSTLETAMGWRALVMSIRKRMAGGTAP